MASEASFPLLATLRDDLAPKLSKKFDPADDLPPESLKSRPVLATKENFAHKLCHNKLLFCCGFIFTSLTLGFFAMIIFGSVCIHNGEKGNTCGLGIFWVAGGCVFVLAFGWFALSFILNIGILLRSSPPPNQLPTPAGLERL
eukprot:TRINITY_DN22331_c0_g1_i1.p1 TRINITY_DN22331_c0_g1~~TRINITY_DN22331_c0_g1_i1.p1  ORF type:complete len:143 (-),score=22.20 TRINITY_DN22331_c0_g1_i1:16-444(-)